MAGLLYLLRVIWDSFKPFHRTSSSITLSQWSLYPLGWYCRLHGCHNELQPACRSSFRPWCSWGWFCPWCGLLLVFVSEGYEDFLVANRLTIQKLVQTLRACQPVLPLLYRYSCIWCFFWSFSRCHCEYICTNNCHFAYSVYQTENLDGARGLRGWQWLFVSGIIWQQKYVLNNHHRLLKVAVLHSLVSSLGSSCLTGLPPPNSCHQTSVC